jgi:hypothetical protein
MNLRFTLNGVLRPLLSFVLLLSAATSFAQVSQSFDNLTTGLDCGNAACNYTDPNIASHVLVDQVSPVVIPVSDVGGGSTIGFSTAYIANGSTGFSDGDFFGVMGQTQLILELGVAAQNGMQAFFMEDTDGAVDMTFSPVYLNGTASPTFSMYYILEETTWETSDFVNIRIDMDMCAAATTVTLLNTNGVDIDALSIESAGWTQLMADLTAYVDCRATLIISFSSNTAGEELAFDNITFTEGSLSTVELSVSSNAGTETDGSVISVTATAAQAVVGDQTVNIDISGTAITASDYMLSNTSITIPNGTASGSVTFTIQNDTDIEGLESAVLTISNPSSGVVLGSTISQNIAITDNDFPSVELSVSSNAGTETDGSVISVTATAAQAVVGDQTVNIDISGTAITASDYMLSNTSITIPNGTASGSVTFTIQNDTDIEGLETATLTLVSPSIALMLGSTISQNIAITDNPDADNDTIPNDVDNCPNQSNADQADLDEDDIGDVCDSDADNDQVTSATDMDDLDPLVCLDTDFDSCDDCSSSTFAPNDDGLDTDGDGLCDVGDLDDDNDDIADEIDNCPLVENLDQNPSVCDDELCFPIIIKSKGAAVICL